METYYRIVNRSPLDLELVASSPGEERTVRLPSGEAIGAVKYRVVQSLMPYIDAGLLSFEVMTEGLQDWRSEGF